MNVQQSTASGVDTIPSLPMPELRHLVLAASSLVALLQTMGGAPGEGAGVMGLLLAGLIGWKLDYRYLAALLILSFPTLGLAKAVGDLDAAPHTDAVGYVSIAGSELSAPLVAMLTATARTLVEVVRARERRLGWPSRWPVLLLGGALVIAGLCGVHGRALGLNRWSEGVRSVVAVGGFFWGYALTRTPYFSAERLERLVLRVTLVGSAVAVAGVLRGHLIFPLIGLAAALLPVFIVRRQPVAVALTAALCLVGLVGLTLTTTAIVLLAAGALIIGSMPLTALRRVLVYGAGAVVLVGSVGAIWAVRTYGDSLAIEMTQQAVENEGIISYAAFKLMGDRGPLWLAAIQQIEAGPHLIPPTGRALLPSVGLVMGAEWEFGPHNSALQVLRSIGLLGGGVLLGLMAYFLFRALRGLTGPGSTIAKPLAAAFTAVVLVGVTTGDFPVQDVGFFVWVIGGIAAGSTNGH